MDRLGSKISNAIRCHDDEPTWNRVPRYKAHHQLDVLGDIPMAGAEKVWPSDIVSQEVPSLQGQRLLMGLATRMSST